MTAGDLALVLTTVLCVLGFIGLALVLMRMLQAMRELQVAVDDLRDAGLTGVELVDRGDDLLPGVLVARAEVGAAFPQLVDDRADRALGHARQPSEAGRGCAERPCAAAEQ